MNGSAPDPSRQPPSASESPSTTRNERRQRWLVLSWFITLIGAVTIEICVLLACCGLPAEPLMYGVVIGMGIVALGLILLWSSGPR
jgi:hypothetical protein